MREKSETVEFAIMWSARARDVKLPPEILTALEPVCDMVELIIFQPTAPITAMPVLPMPFMVQLSMLRI